VLGAARIEPFTCSKFLYRRQEGHQNGAPVPDVGIVPVLAFCWAHATGLNHRLKFVNQQERAVHDVGMEA